MADTRFKKYFSKNAEKSDKKEKDDEEYLKRGRDKKKPLSPEDSYEYLRKCLKANCCNCCYSLLSFFKELFKAIGGDPNNKLCDVLGDMSDLFLAIVSDCFFLLKRCCFCVIESVVPTNKKET